MIATDAVDSRASFIFAGGLSLGLIFLWSMLGWNTTPSVFGAVATTGQLYPIVIQMAIVAALILVSFLSPSSPRTHAVVMLLGIVCAFGSILLTGRYYLVGGILLGAAQGFMMALWLYVFRNNLLHMLLMLYGGSSFAYAASLVAVSQTGVGITILAFVLPPLAAYIMRWPRKHVPQNACAVSSPNNTEDPLLATAFRLCCFASGIVSFNAPVSLDSGTGLMATVSFVCFALLVLMGLPQLEIPFALLALGACVFMGCTLALNQVPALLVDCIYVSYWMLFLCALGWLARSSVSYYSCLRGWASLYFITMIANALSLFIPRSIGCAVALVLMAAIFLGAFIKTSLSHRTQAIITNTPTPISTDDAGVNIGRIETIARGVELTDAERDVFVLLAKGFPLKPIAAQLHISESTAKYHRHNIYRKLSISSREELIALVNEPDR